MVSGFRASSVFSASSPLSGWAGCFSVGCGSRAAKGSGADQEGQRRLILRIETDYAQGSQAPQTSVHKPMRDRGTGVDGVDSVDEEKPAHLHPTCMCRLACCCLRKFHEGTKEKDQGAIGSGAKVTFIATKPRLAIS